jgi:5-methylcytosine-specific restriction endonuclease McrA
LRRKGNKLTKLTEGQIRYRKYHDTYAKYRKKFGSYFRDKYSFEGMRQIALERDNFTCQSCGMTQEQHMALFGRSLTIHHIDGQGRYSRNINNKLDNLITLCFRCHGKGDIKKRKPFTEWSEDSKEKVIGNLVFMKKNANKKFYDQWTREGLIDELYRLNKLLKKLSDLRTNNV